MRDGTIGCNLCCRSRFSLHWLPPVRVFRDPVTGIYPLQDLAVSGLRSQPCCPKISGALNILNNRPSRPCKEAYFEAKYLPERPVKILAVSDMVLDRFYSANLRSNYGDVRLVLGCGDLPYEYLEFLVSALDVPLLYVPGNHDPGYDKAIPDSQADGCEFLDLRVMHVKGLNIAGMGGSMRYHPGQRNQYTQAEMYTRLLQFSPTLWWHQFRHHGGLDILIAHSPPFGIHDDDDMAHIGFSAFISLIHIFKPRYFLHGHTMVYKSNLVPPVTKIGRTTIINVYPYRLIELEPAGGR